MGNSSSKAASRAASAAKRSYPSAGSTTAAARAPPPQSSSQPTTAAAAAAQAHPSLSTHPPSADHKSAIVDLDARDPDFASSLSRAGRAQRVPQPPSPTSAVAQPQSSFPTSSQPPRLQQAPTGQQIFPPDAASRSSNPALQMLAARQRIAEQYQTEQEEMGRKGFQGRTLLAAKDLREALNMRDAGVPEEEIERKMRLKRGLLSGMPDGVVGNVAGET